MVFEQQPYDIRCEWGEHGLRHLAARSDAVVIVDVLSFSTSVDIALSREGSCPPVSLARCHGSSVRTPARRSWPMTSGRARRATLSRLPRCCIFPSGRVLSCHHQMGALLSTLTGRLPTFTGCLRNAKALAAVLRTIGRRISLIPAGERWPDGSSGQRLRISSGPGRLFVICRARGRLRRQRRLRYTAANMTWVRTCSSVDLLGTYQAGICCGCGVGRGSGAE